MPLYDYRCTECGHVEEYVVRMADLETVAFFHCATQMERLISAPHVAADYAPYECPVTGRQIEGRRQHEENLKRTGCRLLEPGESAQYIKDLPKKREQDLERSVNQAVDAAARQMGLNT